MTDLNTPLNNITFGQLMLTIFSIVVGAIAIKITITFDWNKHLEMRQKNLIMKLQNTCTHINLSFNEKKELLAEGLFESPPGTWQWQCKRFGLIRNNMSQTEVNETYRYYIKNYNEYKKRNNRFNKLLKKAGML